MYLASPFTGATSKTSLEAQVAISNLVITKNGSGDFNAEKINVTLVSSKSPATIIPVTRIKRLAVIMKPGIGYQKLQKEANGTTTASYNLLLADFGAIDFEAGDKLEINLTDLDAGATYSVLGIQSPIRARSYNEYSTEVINGAETQQRPFVPVANTKLIAISNNGGLSSLRLTYSNGNEVTLLPDELSAIARENNLVAFQPDVLIEGDAINQSVSSGAVDFFIVPFIMGNSGIYVTKYEVTTVGGIDLTIARLVRRAF